MQVSTCGEPECSISLSSLSLSLSLPLSLFLCVGVSILLSEFINKSTDEFSVAELKAVAKVIISNPFIYISTGIWF